MKPMHGRRVAAVRRVFSAGVLMLTLSALASPAPVPTAARAPGETPTAVKGETRLRKLHLVRPDLIPYPIAFEVYC